VNQKKGRKSLYSHAVFTPGQPGWMEALDQALTEYKPDAMKGYTVGSPFDHSKYPWRLDDEKLVYPQADSWLSKAEVFHLTPSQKFPAFVSISFFLRKSETRQKLNAISG
jgi:hypothetical protein